MFLDFSDKNLHLLWLRPELRVIHLNFLHVYVNKNLPGFSVQIWHTLNNCIRVFVRISETELGCWGAGICEKLISLQNGVNSTILSFFYWTEPYLLIVTRELEYCTCFPCVCVFCAHMCNEFSVSNLPVVKFSSDMFYQKKLQYILFFNMWSVLTVVCVPVCSSNLSFQIKFLINLQGLLRLWAA
jgi:hypothetical protein